MHHVFSFACVAVLVLMNGRGLAAAEIDGGEVFSVIEVAFNGPLQSAADSPARDVELRSTFRHESGEELTIWGFHDGENRFKVRFCPTRPGRWELKSVKSNVAQLKDQRVGDHVTVAPSSRHGFWIVDEESPGRRWCRRSDGSHQYIFGNTHYSFLSRMRDTGPTGGRIIDDVAANAKHFKKLRFTFGGDRYPHPTEKPFLDDAGKPTDSGDHSHRPNPRWFRERVDVAVAAAIEHDLIADLILCGPDVEDARATLRAAANKGDCVPYLRYVAARYGSYPNVWICLCNEYDIKKPMWNEQEISEFGSTIRDFLPYPTPLSIHASQHPDHGPKRNEEPAWATAFDELPPWNDHQILQRKLKTIALSADIIDLTWRARGAQRRTSPTINDELSYTGVGDKHTEADTISAHLGAFLGGGYASTGEKRGNKLGHYFWGEFNEKEHAAAVHLGWLRKNIDKHVAFWKMAPSRSFFLDLDPAFRAMAFSEREVVLGTDKASEVVADLHRGEWTIRRFDAIAMEETLISEKASGRMTLKTPDSRAVLYHFKKN